MTRSRTGTVAVLGHYGQLNLGDESITAAAITGIRALRLDARVIGISLDPDDTRARHGIESFALRREVSRTPVDPPAKAAAAPDARPAGRGLRRFATRIPGLARLVRAIVGLPGLLCAAGAEARALVRAWRALAGSEVVIVAGSNQLLDQFGGAWGFPYTLLKWTLLARARGARVVLLSVGAGPLDGGLAKRFILWTLHLAQYASVRDPGSARLVREIGWRGPLPVKPDLAFGLDAGRSVAATTAADASRTLTVAVNLMPVHDPRYWPGDKPHVRAGYVDAMVGFVEDVLGRGHRVALFSTQPADEWVAAEVMERLGRRDVLSLERIRSLDELARLYRRCDVVAATRFHGILLALRFARPVIGVCYYRKSRELLRDFGLERYAFDLDGVTAAQLAEAFAAIVAERPAVERQMRGALAARETELAEQYQIALNVEIPEAVQA